MEDKASRVEDGYATDDAFTDPEKAVLSLTDSIIGVPGSSDADTRALLEAHLTQAEIAELALGVGLFHGMSKVLITLGLEPEQMPVTVVPTPGSS